MSFSSVLPLSHPVGLDFVVTTSVEGSVLLKPIPEDEIITPDEQLSWWQELLYPDYRDLPDRSSCGHMRLRGTESATRMGSGGATPRTARGGRGRSSRRRERHGPPAGGVSALGARSTSKSLRNRDLDVAGAATPRSKSSAGGAPPNSTASSAVLSRSATSSGFLYKSARDCFLRSFVKAAGLSYLLLTISSAGLKRSVVQALLRTSDNLRNSMTFGLLIGGYNTLLYLISNKSALTRGAYAWLAGLVSGLTIFAAPPEGRHWATVFVASRVADVFAQAMVCVLRSRTLRRLVAELADKLGARMGLPPVAAASDHPDAVPRPPLLGRNTGAAGDPGVLALPLSSPSPQGSHSAGTSTRGSSFPLKTPQFGAALAESSATGKVLTLTGPGGTTPASSSQYSNSIGGRSPCGVSKVDFTPQSRRLSGTYTPREIDDDSCTPLARPAESHTLFSPRALLARLRQLVSRQTSSAEIGIIPGLDLLLAFLGTLRVYHCVLTNASLLDVRLREVVAAEFGGRLERRLRSDTAPLSSTFAVKLWREEVGDFRGRFLNCFVRGAEQFTMATVGPQLILRALYKCVYLPVVRSRLVRKYSGELFPSWSGRLRILAASSEEGGANVEPKGDLPAGGRAGGANKSGELSAGQRASDDEDSSSSQSDDDSGERGYRTTSDEENEGDHRWSRSPEADLPSIQHSTSGPASIDVEQFFCVRPAPSPPRIERDSPPLTADSGGTDTKVVQQTPRKRGARRRSYSAQLAALRRNAERGPLFRSQIAFLLHTAIPMGFQIFRSALFYAFFLQTPAYFVARRPKTPVWLVAFVASLGTQILRNPFRRMEVARSILAYALHTMLIYPPAGAPDGAPAAGASVTELLQTEASWLGSRRRRKTILFSMCWAFLCHCYANPGPLPASVYDIWTVPIPSRDLLTPTTRSFLQYFLDQRATRHKPIATIQLKGVANVAAGEAPGGAGNASPRKDRRP